MSDVLLQYLVLVRPLEMLMAPVAFSGLAHDATTDLREALFVAYGHRVTAENVRAAVHRAFLQHVQKDVTFSMYRHAAIGFSRHLVQLRSPETYGELLPIAEQAGHSQQTEDVVYARAYGDDLVATDQALERYLSASMLWHRLHGYSSNGDAIKPVVGNPSVSADSLAKVVERVVDNRLASVDTVAARDHTSR